MNRSRVVCIVSCMVLLCAVCAAATVALLICRMQLVEARDLIAEHFMASLIAETLISQKRPGSAAEILEHMRCATLQYAVTRRVHHSDLALAPHELRQGRLPRLGSPEAPLLQSYMKKTQSGPKLWARIENRVYHKWPGGRTRWVDWCPMPDINAEREER